MPLSTLNPSPCQQLIYYFSQITGTGTKGKAPPPVKGRGLCGGEVLRRPLQPIVWFRLANALNL